MDLFQRVAMVRLQNEIAFLNRLVALLFFVTMCHLGWPWIVVTYNWLADSQVALVLLPLAFLYFGMAFWVWWACNGKEGISFETREEKLKKKEDRKEEETIEAD